MIGLKDMTQEQWDRLSEKQRQAMRDLSGLTKQLYGLEGWRVEVKDNYGETRRFIVGRSSGWRPCHIELPRKDSRAGRAANVSYQQVTPIRKVR